MTAETALAIPVVAVVLLLSIWVLACVSAQLRCVDAARVAARAAARGDTPSEVSSAGHRVAPAGSAVSVRRDGPRVEVVVSAQVRPLGGVLRAVPGVRVAARAVADVEQAP